MMTAAKKNKKCSKQKCKVLCTECTHSLDMYINEETVYVCSAYPIKYTKSCVTGEVTTHRAYCKDHNKNGQCRKYKPLSFLRLKKLLKEYIKDNPKDWACRNTTKGVVAEDLLTQLEGNPSTLVEGIYTGDSPYDHHIIATEQAVQYAKDKRKYRDEAKADGDLYE